MFGVFDKDEFAVLLKKAIGERSINQFAAKCGVSATYISKLLRSLIDNPPGVEIIKKISTEAYDISYEDFMNAAGHIDSNDSNITSRQNNKVSPTSMLNDNQKKIFDILDRAGDLDNDDYEIIAEQIDLLIEYARKKKHLTHKGKEI